MPALACASLPFSFPPARSLRGAAGLLLAALLSAWLGTPSARAQGSLSPPIGTSIGDSIYSESTQNGPSGTLFEGDNSLTNPFLRGGISDPLGFLIETGTMSPFLVNSTVDGYTDSFLRSQVVNDSILAERFSEYRENRALMGGAGARSLPRGRSVAAGATLSGSIGPRTNAPSALAFGGGSMRALFAAGSSGLAAQSTDNGTAAFIDPNALLAALSSSTALNGMQGAPSAASGAALTTSGAAMTASSEGAFSYSTPDEISMNFPLSLPTLPLVPPPTGTATGPQPGSIFPDATVSIASTTGFMDATMGTAGIVGESGDTGLSHSLSPLGDPSDSPFRPLSTEGSRFLSPSLLARGVGVTQQPGAGIDFEEVARKARLHAMIYNPSAPLPSAFEQRKMEREYKRGRGGGGRPSRYPVTLVPSIRP